MSPAGKNRAIFDCAKPVQIFCQSFDQNRRKLCLGEPRSGTLQTDIFFVSGGSELCTASRFQLNESHGRWFHARQFSGFAPGTGTRGNRTGSQPFKPQSQPTPIQDCAPSWQAAAAAGVHNFKGRADDVRCDQQHQA